MKNLPIGISTLKSILDDNMVYIDKTDHAYNMIKTRGRFFLSRPRRFGKSLFVDTLKEIFEGNKELFKGLYIYDKWNWEKSYPVVKIDFASGLVKDSESLKIRITDILSRNANRLKCSLKTDSDLAGMLNSLIDQCLEKYSRPIVLLIDEYDKPLLDNIEDHSMAIKIRDGLKAFYSVIKEQDANIQFVLLTGVSKFSKVNIFSGINNLEDITLDRTYATICGYTHTDLETSFQEHLKDVNWQKLRTWYNGYNFLGEPVYNPFDILLFISKGKQFKHYWFETGTPSFLVKLFQKNKYFLPDLNNIEISEEMLGSFEIDSIEPVTLLFQSGYLTITEIKEKMNSFIYKLSFPNLEVKIAFNQYLISAYSKITQDKIYYAENSYNALTTGSLAGLKDAIFRLFAGIPYRNFTNNDLLEFEGWYASVLYAFFSAINCDIIPEDITNKGQADMTVMINEYIYVMEIKVISQASTLVDRSSDKPGERKTNSALQQIQQRGYAEKYKNSDEKTVFEVGMIFSQTERNLVAFDWA